MNLGREGRKTSGRYDCFGDFDYFSWSPLLATTFRGHCSKPMWCSTALHAILQEVEGLSSLCTLCILQPIDLYSTLFSNSNQKHPFDSFRFISIHFDSFRFISIHFDSICIGTPPPHSHPPRNRWLQEVVAAHPVSF